MQNQLDQPIEQKKKVKYMYNFGCKSWKLIMKILAQMQTLELQDFFF